MKPTSQTQLQQQHASTLFTTTPSKPTTNMKPTTGMACGIFDGSTPFHKWLEAFELSVRAGCWTQQYALLNLIALLPTSLTSSLSPTITQSYESLTKYLLANDEKNPANIYSSGVKYDEFRKFVMIPNERIQDYRTRLESHALRFGYAFESNEVFSLFLDKLTPPSLQQQVRGKAFTDLESAYAYAMKKEVARIASLQATHGLQLTARQPQQVPNSNQNRTNSTKSSPNNNQNNSVNLPKNVNNSNANTNYTATNNSTNNNNINRNNSTHQSGTKTRNFPNNNNSNTQTNTTVPTPTPAPSYSTNTNTSSSTTSYIPDDDNHIHPVFWSGDKLALERRCFYCGEKHQWSDCRTAHGDRKPHEVRQEARARFGGSYSS
jgi:hypothetical protein